MLIPKEIYIDDKIKWTIKRNTEDQKWTVYKNDKKLKNIKIF